MLVSQSVEIHRQQFSQHKEDKHEHLANASSAEPAVKCTRASLWSRQNIWQRHRKGRASLVEILREDPLWFLCVRKEYHVKGVSFVSPYLVFIYWAMAKVEPKESNYKLKWQMEGNAVESELVCSRGAVKWRRSLVRLKIAVEFSISKSSLDRDVSR